MLGPLVVLYLQNIGILRGKILKLGYMSSIIYGGIVLGTGYKFVYGSNGLMTKLLTFTFPGMNTDWFNGFWAVIFIMTLPVHQII